MSIQSARHIALEKGRIELTIIIIVTHDHLLDLAILAHLAPEVLVECVEMILELTRVHLVFGVVGWVLVQIRQ